MARKPTKKSHKRTTPKARKPQAKSSPEYKVTGRYSPEQQKTIVERMKARHSPVTIPNTIERSDFHITTDIRATSDPLWRHLAAFRRWLIEGGTFTPADWQSLLIDIRIEAHAAGLRPQLGKVEYIVATLSEVREGDPGRMWEEEPDNWSKVILTACGEAGWIQLHDLLDGFKDTGIPADKHKRPAAIEWAESWMNARERQLAEPEAMMRLEASIAAVAQLTTAHAERMDRVERAVLATGYGAGSATRNDPTIDELCSNPIISTDTFGRVRRAAGIEVKLKGAAARNRRYNPNEVDRLIEAALAGKFIKRTVMAEKWAQWGSQKAASKPHASK